MHCVLQAAAHGAHGFNTVMRPTVRVSVPPSTCRHLPDAHQPQGLGLLELPGVQ
jgi:hypothetical protein